MQKSRIQKRLSISFTVIFLLSLHSMPTAQATTYAFGDTGPAGGKIFITPSTVGNSTGLFFEAAPVDVSASRMLWCNSSNQTLPGANGTAIGSGKTNTQAMLDHGCTSGAGFAASQYSAGGFTDWFLPSSGEVVEAQKLKNNGLFTGVGLDNEDIHWTSTWVNSTSSFIWYPYISGAELTTAYSLAAGGFFVRAVRSFSPPIAGGNNGAEDRRKLQAAIEEGRTVILKKVREKDALNQNNLQAAGEPTLSPSMLSELNKILLESLRGEAVTYGQVSFQIARYKIYDQILGNLVGRPNARDLITYGIVEPSAQMKSLALHRLINLPLSERNSITEITAFLSAEAERTANLKARLLARSR